MRPPTALSRHLRVISTLLILMAIVQVIGHEPVGPIQARAATPPNVLIVVTDDQRLDGTLAVMPRTRSWMQGGGRTFTNAFTSSPICCPARGSIFTGRYVHNHGIRLLTDAPALDQSTTLQRYLRDSGYTTALIGKYLNDWEVGVAPPHFDRWTLCSPCSTGGYYGRDFDVDGDVQTVDGYATDFMASSAIGYLREFEANDAQPWFLYVGVGAPHDPYTVEPDHETASVPSWNGNPATFESDRSDKPPYVQERSRLLSTAKDVRTKQLRTLRSVDDLVNGVFRELGTLSERWRTLVFFVTDNGFVWNEHKLGVGKRYPYDQSVRIPFLVRWQNHLPAGTRDPRLASLVDIAPTVLDAAGIGQDPGVPMDGRSLLLPATRERVLIEYFLHPLLPNVPTWAAIRTTTYQYTEYYGDDGTTVTFREYYDHVADPWELTNLLGDSDPTNDPDVGTLSAQLAADRGCLGTIGPLVCP